MAFTLKQGDKAPDFKLEDQDGKTIKLSDLEGKKSVIFFYPAADTPHTRAASLMACLERTIPYEPIKATRSAP